MHQMLPESVMRQIIVPLDPQNLGGPSIKAEAEVIAERSGRGIATISALDGQDISWLAEFSDVFFQTLHDGTTLKVIREATTDDFRKFRAPIWIQGDETPLCCSNPMAFIGQLDDDTICMEPPANAKMWWHDQASFYVFTCPICLEVKAVGQQF